MGQNRQFITLDSIITDYLGRSKQSNNQYSHIFHMAIGGMDTLGLDFFYQILTVKLPKLATETVILPANCLKYTKVGVFNDKGEIIPLKYNNKISTFADLNPDRLQKVQDNTLPAFYDYRSPNFYNYWDGYGFINLYGIPSGAPFIGEFNVDETNGVILLKNFSYDYVVIEYVASPVEGQEYYVPIQFREAMIAWLWWQDSMAGAARKRGGGGMYRDFRHNFFNERRLAGGRYKPIETAQIYELHLEQQRLVKT